MGKVGRVIGIDLGTTNSVVATLDTGGSRILQNKEAESQTRSVVGYHKGNVLIGTSAVRRWPLAPRDTIISIKRLMGRAYSDSDVEKVKKWAQYEIVEPSEGTKDSLCVKLGGEEYFPVDIAAMILGKLKEDAEFVLGDDVTHAVITVPAYFSDRQKQATREAGLNAGLTVMKILDEPTAAALAFGMDAKEEEAKTVLVFDLGGGTFDVSVLMMAARSFAQINLEGDMWLGGDNFDQIIVEYVVDQIKKEHDIDPEKNLRFMASLKMEAQKAKEALSSSRIAQIIIPGVLQNDSGEFIDVDTEIARDQFEEMIQPLVDRTVSIVKKAVENANYKLHDIDYVLMAGNSTCIPKVQEAMEKLFGEEKILRKVHPKNSVAIGAALTAAIYISVACPICGKDNALEATECEDCGHVLEPLKKICIKCGAMNKIDTKRCKSCEGEVILPPDPDSLVAPFPYGVQAAGDRFHVFIEKSEPYPKPEEEIKPQTFYTQFPNQRIIRIPVYGGDNREAASKNPKMGEAYAILPPNLPEETPVRIKLWLNRNGIFELTAQLDDGKDLNARIARGDEQAKILDIFMGCDDKWDKIKSVLPPKDKEEGDRIRNEVLDNLGKDKKKEARENAKELEDYLKKLEDETRKPPKDDLGQMAEGMVNYVTYIVNEYGWLIGQSAHRLNDITGELQEAVRKSDSNLMKSKIDELSIELERLIQTKDPSGKIVPTLLGTFMMLHRQIIERIQPADPALAQNLREELSGVERAFKERQPDAEAKLMAFVKKFGEVIPPPPPGGIKCIACGKRSEKPEKGRFCQHCGADLYLLAVKGTSTKS